MKVILLRGQGYAPLKFTIGWVHLVLLLLLIFNLLFFSWFTRHETTNRLTRRMAMLEVQTQRLSQLGEYIAKQTKVDIKSFGLDQRPAVGGIVGESFEPQDRLAGSNDLSKVLSKELSEAQLLRSIQLSEQRLKTQQKRLKRFTKPISIQQQVHFLNPVKTGYVSSKFGMRNDPINGRHRFHQGIDIAGRKGSPIETIASGFVTFAGRKGGYGNVVEIHHSDSLKSRYAHLNTILVKKGGVVRQGEKIATLGATGRVTGPHLHLEVWKNGRAVNPEKYLNLALGVYAVK